MPKSICRVTKYANDVLSGEIVAGELLRLACQRHVDDLKHGHKRGLKWDQKAADDFLDYLPNVLTVTEGEHEGKPFHPLDWHVFAGGSLFGWKNKNGLRRFRFAWIELGKGQAKSPFSAAVAIYMLRFCEIPRADIYCIGKDKDQARVIFKDAVAMVRAPIPGEGGATLEDVGGLVIRGTGELAYKIEYPHRGGAMQPIASNDANSGPKPCLVLGDEVHEYKNNIAIETWRDALAKMSGDPLMILTTNTPANDQHVATEYCENTFLPVLRREILDDSVFSLFYRTDEDDDPFNDPSCWPKSLPALGVTFPVENVEAQVETSTYDISRRLRVSRLYFGIPVGSSGFWMDEGAWDKAQGTVEPHEMKGRRCHLSVDLSKKNDLTAVTATWEPVSNDPVYRSRTWYWTRGHAIEKREAEDRIPYRELESAGEITIVDARVIKYSFIAAWLQQFCSTQNVEQMAADSAFLAELIDACDDLEFKVWLFEGEDEAAGEGLKIVRHKQGAQIAFPKIDPNNPTRKIYPNWLDMPHSIRTMIDAILDGKMVIHKQRLCTINAANAILVSDKYNNEYFDKKRSRGRIDGTVTKAMGMGTAKKKATVAKMPRIISL